MHSTLRTISGDLCKHHEGERFQFFRSRSNFGKDTYKISLGGFPLSLSGRGRKCIFAQVTEVIAVKTGNER